jgi:hypothetical protein
VGEGDAGARHQNIDGNPKLLFLHFEVVGRVPNYI